MSARVTFLEERPAEGAPSKARVFAAKNAIATRGGGPAAVVVRGGRAIVVPLKLGPEIDGRVEILAGLEGGESLVVNPTDEIRNGTPVRLRPKS
jgi:hypothetical protein